MSSAKAAVALLVSVLIAGITAAETTVTDRTWLAILGITLAAVNPIAVWATSNTRKSSADDLSTRKPSQLP